MLRRALACLVVLAGVGIAMPAWAAPPTCRELLANKFYLCDFSAGPPSPYGPLNTSTIYFPDVGNTRFTLVGGGSLYNGFNDDQNNCTCVPTGTLAKPKFDSSKTVICDAIVGQGTNATIPLELVKLVGKVSGKNSSTIKGYVVGQDFEALMSCTRTS